jgi:hypothetical protein
MKRSMKLCVGIMAVAMGLGWVTGCTTIRKLAIDEKVTMNDLPEAVKIPAEKETAGCRIIEVEREYKYDQVIYAITYDQADTIMEIEYSVCGALLFKGLE